MTKLLPNKKITPEAILIGSWWRYLERTLLLMALCLSSYTTFAQQTVTLKGKVQDAENKPVVGATVIIKGGNQGVITTTGGAFVLKAKIDDKSVLEVSFVGMQTKDVAIGDKRDFVVTLADDAQTIEGVVVTGFQNIKKASFTGSSAKIRMDEIAQKGVVDVSRMLEGQVAGVSIQNVSGTFGAAPKVRVRGATSITGENKPLWVIDGVVHEDVVNISNDQLTSGDPTTLLGSAVAGLNANDIESIDVLKDASATALYGARAMNGVVVVTTKRGAEGRPIIKYSGNFTVQLKPSYDNYDIMNSMDQMSVYAELERKGFLNSDMVNYSNSGIYGKMYNLINTYNSQTGEFMLENTPQARRKFLERYAYANTDWFDVLFRNSLQQEHSISVSSGSARSRSYVSLSYLNDSGWTIADKVNRYTANYRNDFTIAKNFNMGFQIVGSLRQQQAPGSLSRRSNTVEGSYDRDFDINPFSYALNTSRALTPYDENGNLEYFTRNYAPFNIISELDNNKIKLNMVDVKAQLEAVYKFAKGFSYEFTGAVRYVKSDREHEIREKSNMAEAYRADGTATIRRNNKFLYKNPDDPNSEPVVVLPYGGFYNRAEDMMSSFDIRNSVKYTGTFKKHTVNALVGQQIKAANRQKYTNTGYGYQYDQGGTAFIDYRILKQMVESNFPYYGMGMTYDRFAAFYANADYSFDRRYVASATIRYDGSNGLGKDASARWLPTWNVSAKWNVNNEKFMENQKFIDYLAIRGSHGLTASMPPAANATAVFMNENSNRVSAGDIESQIVLEQLKNSDLTWEKGHLTNVGLDLGMFERRLDFVVDFWWRKSFDLISSIRTPGIGGEIVKYANYADMKSSGIDVSLSVRPIMKKNFTWRSVVTFGYNTTEITRAENKPRIFDMVNSNGGNLQGYPVKSLFSVQYKGLNPDNGTPMFINENGDLDNGVYMQSTNLDHLKYEGSIDPKFNGGFSNTFTYKGLSLNVFLTFQGGNKIRLTPVFDSSYSDLDATPRIFFDRWVNPGDEYYSFVASIANSQTISPISSKYPYSSYNYSNVRVADGGFLRVKTISLTYTLPKTLLEKSGFLSNVSFTLAATNLWLIYADKKLNGQDPEFYNSGGVAQPMPKQFTFALNVGF